MGKVRYNTNAKSKSNFKCAAYIRLSQEDGDKEESNSVTSQREIIDYYLKQNRELELFDYYIDDGFTGTDFKRPSFQRMLNDLEAKNINTIIIKDLSRFGRNFIEVGNFIEQVFPVYKTRFISISDNIDNYKNPESLNSMIFPFKNMINEEYCRDISKKIRSVKYARAKKGDFMQGHAPYGYIKDPEDYHKFIIDEEAAKNVRLIYDMFVNGNGYGKIARYLNDNNIYSPSRYKCETQNLKYRSSNTTEDNYKDKRWTINSVRRTLTNEVYCGDLIQGKEKVISHKNHKRYRTDKEDWIVVKDSHEAIISRELFKQVHDMIENKTYDGAINTQPNIYAGHIKCAVCHRFMTRKYTGHRKSNPNILNYNYYCSTYLNISHSDCILNKMRSEDLDKIMLKAIKHQIKLYLNIDKLSKEISYTNNSSDLKIKIEKIDNEINKRRKIRQKYYEDWKLNIITKDEYLEYINSEEKTINILTERHNKYKEQLKDEENIDNKIELFSKINGFKDIKVLNKQIIDDLVDDIYVKDGKVEICFKYQDEYKKLRKMLNKKKTIKHD